MVKKKTGSLLDYYNFTKAEQRKYPVVTGVLKQLTPERIEKEIEKVKKVELPMELKKWIKEYEKIGGHRNEFIWKWLYSINKIWIFSPVQIKYRDSLAMIKTLCNMFIILVDDISVRNNKEELLNELLGIPFKKKHARITRLIKKDLDYLFFAQKIWYYVKVTIEQYPKYSILDNIFYYDTEQFLNSVKYTHLIHKNPSLINIIEYWFYLCYKMQVIFNFDLDLMCCDSTYDFKNLGKEREIILHLQKTGRINNWLTTWEREVKEGDFSNIIVAYALDNRIIEIKDLKDKNKVIKQIKNFGLEKKLLIEWIKRYEKMYRLSKKSNLKNNKEIFIKAKYFLFMHLVGKGHI